jgi:4'-phosphopantetheinyl transferase EntD
MTHRSSFRPAVAMATVHELPAGLRSRPDAERRASRLAARRAIRRLAGRLAAIEIRRRPDRPPLARFRLLGEPPQQIALSLTHREGRAAAVAASPGVAIGIDLERTDAVPAGAERMFMTPFELRQSPRLASSIVWSLKEASWKALRLGGDVSFHDLELDIDPAGLLRGLILRRRRIPASATVVSPWSCFVLATVQIGRRP